MYTFLRRFELPTRLCEACCRPFEKKVHGTSAANVKMGYGMPSDGTRASRPKNRLKTIIVSTG